LIDIKFQYLQIHREML